MIFLDEILKIVIHILNRVFSKAVPKISFDLSVCRRHSINFLHVWGCPTKDKMYNLTMKVATRTTCCYLIGSLDISKGYRIYYPDKGIKVVESNHARFLKSDMDDYKCSHTRDMILKKKVIVPIPITQRNNIFYPERIVRE